MWLTHKKKIEHVVENNQIWKNIKILVESLQYFVIRSRVAMNIICITWGTLVGQWQTVEKQYQIYGSHAVFFYTVTKSSIFLTSSVMTGDWHYYALYYIYLGKKETHFISLFKVMILTMNLKDPFLWREHFHIECL